MARLCNSCCIALAAWLSFPGVVPVSSFENFHCVLRPLRISTTAVLLSTLMDVWGSVTQLHSVFILMKWVKLNPRDFSTRAVGASLVQHNADFSELRIWVKALMNPAGIRFWWTAFRGGIIFWWICFLTISMLSPLFMDALSLWRCIGSSGQPLARLRWGHLNVKCDVSLMKG